MIIEKGTEDIVDIKIGDLIEWMKNTYIQDKYRNSFVGNFRTGLIQQCNLYLEDQKIKEFK